MAKRKASEELNLRERKLIKGLAEGKSILAAATDAGYSESYAKGKGGQIVGKGRIIKTISEILDGAGLDDETLVQVISQGIGAMRSIAAISGKEATGGTVDFVEVPDFSVRHRYLETALKLKGYLRDKVQVEVTAETYEQKIRRLRGIEA